MVDGIPSIDTYFHSKANSPLVPPKNSNPLLFFDFYSSSFPKRRIYSNPTKRNLSYKPIDTIKMSEKLEKKNFDLSVLLRPENDANFSLIYNEGLDDNVINEDIYQKVKEINLHNRSINFISKILVTH